MGKNGFSTSSTEKIFLMKNTKRKKRRKGPFSTRKKSWKRAPFSRKDPCCYLFSIPRSKQCRYLVISILMAIGYQALLLVSKKTTRAKIRVKMGEEREEEREIEEKRTIEQNEIGTENERNTNGWNHSGLFFCFWLGRGIFWGVICSLQRWKNIFGNLPSFFLFFLHGKMNGQNSVLDIVWFFMNSFLRLCQVYFLVFCVSFFWSEEYRNIGARRRLGIFFAFTLFLFLFSLPLDNIGLVPSFIHWSFVYMDLWSMVLFMIDPLSIDLLSIDLLSIFACFSRRHLTTWTWGKIAEMN